MHIGRHIVQELVLTFGEPVVERWEQPLNEAELDEVERHRALGRAHDVTIAIVEGERLAVIRKRDYPEGAYRIPSGGIHPEESFVDGATREALEETGLSVRIEDYPLQVHADFVCGRRRARWTTHVMLARVLPTSSGKPGHRDSDEIESARWIRWRELIDEVNPILRDSGRGGLRYRARLHERLDEILRSADRPARPVSP
jgi:8-oxo-dGTP pyrophosphatase MutT (NUDIX family)